MRRRNATGDAALRHWCLAISGWLGSNLDEVLLSVGLWCVCYALWPRFGREALIVPGITMIWIGLPSRVSLVARLPEKRKGT